MSAPDFRKQVIDVIPMSFLIANDVPGATGPTAQCDVVQAIRDLTAAGRRVVDRCKLAEAARDDLLSALEMLHLQALQSTVNDPANEWGMEALAASHAAIAKARGGAA